MHSPPAASLPAVVRRRFDLLVFDWDGTAVPDRRTPVPELDGVLESLLRRDIPVAPVTGTKIENLEQQSLLHIASDCRKNLFVCTNRGSEVFSYDASGDRRCLDRRQASPEEERQLTEAAEELQRRLRARNLETRIEYNRVNRRKVDLIPEPAWDDPPKARIAELIAATTARLRAAGLENIGAVLRLAGEVAREAGLADPRLTSDGKYVEIGLTDKSDAVRWLIENVARPDSIDNDRVLIGGDEFGDIGSFTGSDERMQTEVARGAAFVSVGSEPNGVPAGVLHLPGGPERFLQVLRWQLHLRGA